VLPTGGTTPANPPATNPAPAPSTAPTVVRYEQNNPAVQYSGTWYPNSGSFNSGGSAVMAMDSSSQASFTFTGTGIKWIGFSDPWSGSARVYLDGALVATVDTYAAVQQSQAVQYSVSGLSSVPHTLTIVAMGTHDASSGGAWVWIDAFDVTTGGQTATPASAAAIGHGVVRKAN
jgi:hypothetical protein